MKHPLSINMIEFTAITFRAHKCSVFSFTRGEIVWAQFAPLHAGTLILRFIVLHFGYAGKCAAKRIVAGSLANTTVPFMVVPWHSYRNMLHIYVLSVFKVQIY
ncbi:hypothetical protein EEL42_12055 [Muribaculaceae bacterium Isolate-100 (HZI)]|nr:hypothetical protein EEL42_12055 [Muribaculaceae bacterium Isolate-100 (HZI)]